MSVQNHPPRRRMTARLRAMTAACVMTLGAALPAPAQTASPDVVSIGGTVTEIIAALGGADRLIARDTTSTYPPEVSALPDVGYMRALSPEGVLSLGATLIIADDGAGPPEALDIIRAADVDYVSVPEGHSADGIAAKITTIGQALGVPDAAKALAAQVDADLKRAIAQAAIRAEGSNKRVLFILSTQGGKITAAGTGTSADAIIRMAGGTNAISEFAGYKQLTDEAIGLAAPHVILMMDRGGDHSAADDELLAMPSVRMTPAAAQRAVVRMNGLLLLGFGPRTPQAVVQLSEALYGAGS